MIKLGVNIDHIATVRQARKEGIPNYRTVSGQCAWRAKCDVIAGCSGGGSGHQRTGRGFNDHAFGQAPATCVWKGAA